ncbi:hypothetical protein PIB30_098538 [Stylosanthes scabra]|uniref:Transposase (Putative), gypsy type n=1 Tax=Stylosanthes scabra TaxID=79078 RepID=A0ABU6YX90_9FABA|nr:hypothetical protein [Stylosanthes scabra]
MRLTEGRVSEGDYLIEAAGPSDRLPFRAAEDRTHFLWVYTELFTCLGVRLPFTDFQREVMTRCRVAASQLHLNGWGFLRAFERVCLHFGFRPSWRVFVYIYQLHAPPPGKGFMCFRAHQGRKLFDAFEESIQEFKWHYFKFLQSLPAGLGKKSKFKCRWIIDHSDAEVGVFLDSLLGDMEKQSQFDRLRLKMVEVKGVGPRSILLTPNVPAASAGASASSSVTVVLLGPSFGAAKSKKIPPATFAEKSIWLDGEEGAQEDPSADLKQKRRKRKLHESFFEDAVLGDDAAWEHKVNPLDRAFPEGFNFRMALDSGITQSSVQKALEPVPPEQLLRIAHRYACKLTACLQVGIESALSHKLKTEKKLVAAKDQVAVLTMERHMALTSPPLQAKINSLTEQLSVARGERLSALE